jgi:hypothetical protein
MPSSDPQTIPKVLKLVEILQPKSILDVGAGNGRYGFLFREKLDWDWGRLARDSWQIKIDAVEAEPGYITPIHQYVYNYIFQGDWLSCNLARYDLIFMGDVLEHFGEGDWQRALMMAKQGSKFTIVVCPNWRGSIAQEAWGGNEYERHRVELSPSLVGGKCVFANSKMFISVFDNGGTGGALDRRDILL